MSHGLISFGGGQAPPKPPHQYASASNSTSPNPDVISLRCVAECGLSGSNGLAHNLIEHYFEPSRRDGSK